MSLGDGTIRKDDGTGGGWSTVKAGLSAAAPHDAAFFVIGGQEAAGRARRLFHYNGLNIVQVLIGDAVATTDIAAPPVDWAGANQPLVGAIHEGYHWGAGNLNNPHIAYRSLRTNHEDFTTTPYQLEVYPGEGERIVAMLSYKGGLLIWKYPVGVYFVDTSSPTPANWRVLKVGSPGAAGPGNVTAFEDDVMWVSPDGSWHLISATNAAGSVHATDIAYRKLGSFARDFVNLSQLHNATLLYYSEAKECILACSAAGAIHRERRLHLDLNRQQDLGERWIWWDRDHNDAIFLRKESNLLVPGMVDDVGQVWKLDQSARTKDGSGYTFEAFLTESDFSQVVPQWAGKRKNLRYLQIEFDPRGSASIAIQLWVDGTVKQTINFTLTAGGLTLPFVLPGVFGAETLAVSAKRRLYGRGYRVALRLISTGNNADVSLTRFILGVELGE